VDIQQNMIVGIVENIYILLMKFIAVNVDGLFVQPVENVDAIPKLLNHFKKGDLGGVMMIFN